MYLVKHFREIAALQKEVEVHPLLRYLWDFTKKKQKKKRGAFHIFYKVLLSAKFNKKYFSLNLAENIFR